MKEITQNAEWKFPLFDKMVLQFKSFIQQGKHIQVFAQSEPCPTKEGKIVQVPILVILVSQNQLAHPCLACTSVQSTCCELVSFSSVFGQNSSIKLTKTQKFSYLQNKLWNRLDQMNIDNLKPYYTYSQFYVDTKEAAKIFYNKNIQSEDNSEVIIKVNDKEQNISFATEIIDSQSELQYWAKFYYLKYFTDKNINNINIEKEEVDQAIIDSVAAQLKEAGLEQRETVKYQWQDAEKQLSKIQDNQIEIFKCYGENENVKVEAQKSPFVNRFLNKASIYE